MKTANGIALKLGQACLTAMVFTACLAGANAVAQTWPSKPMRILAPQPPGGGPDHVLRSIANDLSKRLG